MSGTLAADQITGGSGFSVLVNGQTPISVDSLGNLTLGGGTLIGSRNKIINGKMDIAQRGTSFVSPPNAAYNLDRWRCDTTSTGVPTISQQADVPSSNEFQNSLRVAVTTADAAVAAGDYYLLTQLIEGYQIRDLIGNTFTLSFWVRSSKTGTHCVSLRNAGGDRSWISEYIVNSANTWEKKTLTIAGGLITAGTWNYTTSIGLNVSWNLMGGSTFQTTPGVWQVGNFLASSSQVNCLDTVGNIFAITGVQLEAGAVATPFEHRPIGIEIGLCQRYYWQMRRAIGTIANSTTVWRLGNPCPVRMRAAPTLTLVGTPSLLASAAANVNLSAITQAITTVDAAEAHVTVTSNVAAAGTTGILASDNDANNYIAVNAEL